MCIIYAHLLSVFVPVLSNQESWIYWRQGTETRGGRAPRQDTETRGGEADKAPRQSTGDKAAWMQLGFFKLEV